MDKTYRQMVEHAAYRILRDNKVNDFDKRELSGASLMIGFMFNISSERVKKDIRDIYAKH